jgi:hypothetical protein
MLKPPDRYSTKAEGRDSDVTARPEQEQEDDQMEIYYG